MLQHIKLQAVVIILSLFCMTTIYFVTIRGRFVPSVTLKLRFPINTELQTRYEKRKVLWDSIIQLETLKPRKLRLPDVICIGTEKCGTGALNSFLRNHPLIKTSPVRSEMHYFSAHYRSGKDYYMKLMPNVTADQLVFEKSPSYFNFPPFGTASRMKSLLPNVKIIVIVCDPINRAYSDFVHEKTMAVVNVNSTFDSYVEKFLSMYNSTLVSLHTQPEKYVYQKLILTIGKNYSSHIFIAGYYYYFIKHWLSLFSKEQFYIMDGEDLLLRPGDEIEKLQEFLNLPKLLIKEDFVRNPETGFFCLQSTLSGEENNFSSGCLEKSKGRTRHKPRIMSLNTLALLTKLYRLSNSKLYNLMGRNLTWQ